MTAKTYLLVLKTETLLIVDSYNSINITAITKQRAISPFVKIGDLMVNTDEIVYLTEEKDFIYTATKIDSRPTHDMFGEGGGYIDRRKPEKTKVMTPDDFKLEVQKHGYDVTLSKSNIYIYDEDGLGDKSKEPLAVVPLDIPTFNFFGTVITAKRRKLLRLVLDFINSR